MTQAPGSTPAEASKLATMEGQGAYNRHSQRPAAGGARAIPLLEKAARDMKPGPGDQPILIADYGSSQGRNSLPPMRAAIAILRERFGPDRPICVAHTDLPGNDFNTLFNTLHTNPDSYLRAQPNVFASAIGRSFYDSVFPPGQVALGWSSYAAMWLSRVPASIPGHYWEQRATGAAREAFDTQAAGDWRNFLSLRARELRPMGKLVIVMPAIDDNGFHGAEPIHDAANDCRAELVSRGTIRADERARMSIPGRIRSRTQLLEPFAETGLFAGLTVEHCDVFQLPEAAWTAYLEHGDAHVLAAARTGFFRSVFIPSLADALDPTGSSSDRMTFADALQTALTPRMAGELRELPSTATTMVVSRSADYWPRRKASQFAIKRISLPAGRGFEAP
jgi:SAM dependent carboxyl methyltransferase